MLPCWRGEKPRCHSDCSCNNPNPLWRHGLWIFISAIPTGIEWGQLHFQHGGRIEKKCLSQGAGPSHTAGPAKSPRASENFGFGTWKLLWKCAWLIRLQIFFRINGFLLHISRIILCHICWSTLYRWDNDSWYFYTFHRSNSLFHCLLSSLRKEMGIFH